MIQSGMADGAIDLDHASILKLTSADMKFYEFQCIFHGSKIKDRHGQIWSTNATRSLPRVVKIQNARIRLPAPGSPASHCPLDSWSPDGLAFSLQRVCIALNEGASWYNSYVSFLRHCGTPELSRSTLSHSRNEPLGPRNEMVLTYLIMSDERWPYFVSHAQA